MNEQKTSGETRSPKGVEPNFLNRAIAVCSWLYLLFAFAAWIMLYAGDLWWPATLLLFSPRWLLAIPLFPLAVAATCWRRRSLVVVLLTLLLVLGPIMGFQLPWRAAFSATPPGEQMRVLTCNMHSQTPVRPILERLLAEADPDVVVFQELRREPFDYFSGEQWHIHQRTGGHFLASRYPIRKAEHLGADSMKTPGSLMRYELETPAGVVVLFSLHLASPREGLSEAAHVPETGSFELEENSAVRWQQSQAVARFLEEATEPVLAMGDFNTPPESALFRRVWGDQSDAFTRAGWGWGYTFRSRRTAVRIDHILAGPSWHCERCWVGPYVGSPHRPLLADLILAKQQP